MTTKVKLSRFNRSMQPNELQALVRKQLQNATRALSAALTPTAITDSTTGVAGSSMAAVSLVAKFTHVSGSDLSPKAAFDTAVTAADLAIVTAAAYLNTTFLAPLGLDQVT